MSGLHLTAVNAEGIVADLDLLPAAYRVLLKARAYSEPGIVSRSIRSPSRRCSV